GRAEEEQAPLSAPTRLLEGLARLPEVDDASDLLLGLGLSAHVVELHAPVRVAGLEATDLRDAHQEQGPQQDPEVEDEEDDEGEEEPERRAIHVRLVGEPVP